MFRVNHTAATAQKWPLAQHQILFDAMVLNRLRKRLFWKAGVGNDASRGHDH